MTAREHQAVHRLQLVEHVADQLALDPQLVDDVVLGFLDEILARMEAGDQVVLRGFGIFETRTTPATERRIPDTGVLIDVPSKTRPNFRASKAMKSRVNGGEA